jgi:hypothetical protein
MILGCAVVTIRKPVPTEMCRATDSSTLCMSHTSLQCLLLHCMICEGRAETEKNKPENQQRETVKIRALRSISLSQVMLGSVTDVELKKRICVSGQDTVLNPVE